MIISPIVNPAIPNIAKQTDTNNIPTMFGTLVSGLIGILLTVATIFTFAQLVQAGLEWISSGGDKSNVESARNHITNAIMGLFIVFAAWAIFILILRFFGITATDGIIQFNMPPLL
jgi:hypothetical protein